MASDTTKERVASLKKQFAGKKKVNPFSWMVEELCGVTFVDKPGEDPLQKSRPEALRIALVSLPEFAWEARDFSSLREDADHPAGVDRGAFMRVLAALRNEAAAQMFDIFKEALETAYDCFEPHVICFNELGLPSDNMVPMTRAKTLA